MTRRRWWAATAAIALVVAVVVALVWAGDDDDAEPRAGSTTTTTVSSTSTTSTITPPPTTTTSTSTTEPVGSLPASVTVISGQPGGGSGEVVLEWGTVAEATGYRVVRTDAAGSLLDVMADLNVTTGQVTAADAVVNLFSPQHTYVPAGATLTTPDTSARITYVDVGGPGTRCYRVVAYSPGGDAAPSPVTCSSPP
jgi:hypothetical protein